MWSSKCTLAARSPSVFGDIRQRQVVGGDQADGAALHQPAHQRLRADAPVVRVGAVQEFVDQEQHRGALGPGRAVASRICRIRRISA